MSRVAKQPVEIPAGVNVTLEGQNISVKGSKGALAFTIHEAIEVKMDESTLTVHAKSELKNEIALSGTMRALINNMVTGVSAGFEKKLNLVGVGYRAQAKGQVLDLTLGFSHPVNYSVPEGITVETPSQTEVIIRGVDKQVVGQVAAHIRAYRPPEPYKGKGIRYSDEVVVRKEAKKK